MFAYCETCGFETRDHRTRKGIMKELGCKSKFLWKCKCPGCKEKTLTID